MDVKHVLSFGAGVQSTTILLMSLEGVLPKLDHVIFADTQWEPSAVYRHLAWCQEHAAKHGLTIDVRTAGNLRDDLWKFKLPCGLSLYHVINSTNEAKADLCFTYSPENRSSFPFV